MTKVPFKREMTLHDRDINRRAPSEILVEALSKAREFQKSEFESVQVSGCVVAGQMVDHPQTTADPNKDPIQSFEAIADGGGWYIIPH